MLHVEKHYNIIIHQVHMIVLLETLDELKLLCHRSLLEWSCCWGFTDCSSLSEFFSSISLVF